jgi:hypothetical protein
MGQPADRGERHEADSVCCGSRGRICDGRERRALNGGTTWTKGVLNALDTGGPGSFSYAFNQIPGLTAQSATNLPGTFATVTLIAKANGLVNVMWDTAGGATSLDFFGLTTAPGTSFTILDWPSGSVPEPATAALLSLGLLARALLVRANPSSPGASRGRPGRAREN